MNTLSEAICWLDGRMLNVDLYWRFRRLVKSIKDRVLGKKLCPYCGEYRDELVVCDTCGVAQCSENCYPPEHQKGGECGACMYPDG